MMATAQELMEQNQELAKAVTELEEQTLEEQVLAKLKEIEAILTKLDSESIDLGVFLDQIQSFSDEKKAELQALVDKLDNPLGSKTITTRTFVDSFNTFCMLYYQEVYMKDGNITKYGDVYFQGSYYNDGGGFESVKGFKRQPLPQDVEFDMIGGCRYGFLARPKAGQSNKAGIVGSLDNYLFVWGSNGNGQLGVGNTSVVKIAKAVEFPARVKKMDVSEFDYTSEIALSYALLENGDLYVCGYGGGYALGTGNNSNISTFQKIDSGVSIVEQIPYQLMYMKGNNIYCSGENHDGNLGVGDTSNKLSPVIILSITDTSDVDIKLNLSLDGSNWRGNALIKADGKLLGCGYNAYKTLDNTGNNFLTPKEVKTTSDTPITLGENDTFFSAYLNAYVLREEDGNCVLYASGYSFLGDGSSAGANTPFKRIKQFDGTGWKILTKSHQQYESDCWCIVYNDNKKEIWVCGKNTHGKLGVGNTDDITTLTKVLLPAECMTADKFEVRYSTYDGSGGLQIVIGDDLWACGTASYNRIPKQIEYVQKINKEF